MRRRFFAAATMMVVGVWLLGTAVASAGVAG